MDISIFGVFIAGLVSFLSPCVLPLVPGYVSMLSGVGVEQLKEGEGSSGKLLSSAFAFVLGFSAVFITFGASASAVGSFLLKNKALLAPVAGSLIVLFGLHLVGWLVKIAVKVGLIVGFVLVLIGLALTPRPMENFPLKPIHFFAASLIFLLGPSMTRWLNRDVHLRDVGGKKYLEALMKAFADNIAAHIAVYGPDNHLRLTGLHETQAIDKFNYALSDRGASVRLPVNFIRNGYKGYLEDRRPNSEADPYQIVSRILKTIDTVKVK